MPMGVPMDSIHAPTVPSGPSSGAAVGEGVREESRSLLEIIAQRDAVETEIRALSDVLDSQGVTMATSLTTFDGYPRDDLDLAQIRTIRARIIYLRNDYKALSDQIETGLHDHHAVMRASEAGSTSGASNDAESSSQNPAVAVAEIPFAKVTNVVAGSPAADAGLQAGDGIRKFGSVNWMNHEKLSKVAETVQRNEGVPIMVQVVRKHPVTAAQEEKSLRLVPRRNWGGRGMLGCHLVGA